MPTIAKVAGLSLPTGRLLQAEADISDWMFTRNGKIVGGETIKPLLKVHAEGRRRRASRADGNPTRKRSR